MRQRTIIQRLIPGVAGAAAVAAVVLGVSACGSDDSPEAQSKAVVSSYDQFTAAVAAKDGTKAAGLLAADSLSYFDTVRASALDDDRAALAKLNPLDQITVLSFRQHIPPATLRAGDIKALVSTAVKTEAITGGSSPQQPLTQVKVNGDAATAILKLGMADSTQTQTIKFARESGAWKFDLTSLFGPAKAQLATIQKSTGYSSTKLVRAVTEDRYGKKQADELYNPVGRTPSS